MRFCAFFLSFVFGLETSFSTLTFVTKKIYRVAFQYQLEEHGIYILKVSMRSKPQNARSFFNIIIK